MSIGTMKEADLKLRAAIVQQLDWDPEVDASAIGVSAADGVVTLTGFIDTYAGKLGAERAVKRVRGVRVVANDVNVRLRIERSDADIAADVALALRFRSALTDRVQATVHNGHVTLTGKVVWLVHKRQAESSVRHVPGVRGVINHIVVAPVATEGDIQAAIVSAMRRDADLDTSGIVVSVAGRYVTLAGTVPTWRQREAAEHAAASAAGIGFVDNRLAVEPLVPFPETIDELC